MARSVSSQRWLNRQHSDPYVKEAKKAGYRSRSLFKLQEIDLKYKIIKNCNSIVDLGCSPGGWSQYAVNHSNAKIVGCDLLEMDSLARVSFIQGNFIEDETLAKILESVGDSRVDLIMSDMAPNMSGNKSVDMPKSMYLCELVLELTQSILKKEGYLIMKSFHGEGFEPLLASVRKQFKQVKTIKPESSRKNSRETYLIGLNHLPV